MVKEWICKNSLELAVELSNRTCFQPTRFDVHGSKQQIKYWRHPGCNWKAQRVKDPSQ